VFCGCDILQHADGAGKGDHAGSEVAERPDEDYYQEEERQQLHGPAKIFDPSYPLAAVKVQCILGAVFYTQGVALAEVAFPDLPGFRLDERG